MMRRLLAFVIAMSALPVRAAADPLDALNRFVGTWESSGSFAATSYSRPSTVSGTTVCAWSTGHDFVICQQRVTVNQVERHDIAIYTYDTAAQEYRFDNIGTAHVATTAIAVDGQTITYPGTFADGEKTVKTRTTNIWDDADNYHFTTEYSLDDGGHWTTMLSGAARRTHA